MTLMDKRMDKLRMAKRSTEGCTISNSTQREIKEMSKIEGGGDGGILLSLMLTMLPFILYFFSLIKRIFNKNNGKSFSKIIFDRIYI
jgi:hypothetical protein